MTRPGLRRAVLIVAGQASRHGNGSEYGDHPWAYAFDIVMIVNAGGAVRDQSIAYVQKSVVPDNDEFAIRFLSPAHMLDAAGIRLQYPHVPL